MFFETKVRHYKIISNALLCWFLTQNPSSRALSDAIFSNNQFKK
jgi:hypothetical protein